MRRRELIRVLKDDLRQLRRSSVGIFTTQDIQQRRSERRMVLLHALENRLPEIIEKLETRRE